MHTRSVRLVAASVAFAVVVLLGSVLAAKPSSVPLEKQIAVDLAIAPSTEIDGAYSCTARLTNLADGSVLSAPQVVFRSGEDARMRSGIAFEGEPVEVVIVVSANRADRSATVQVDLQRGESLSSLQKVSVKL